MFRTDASAHEDFAIIGGWETARTEDPKRARWFSHKITKADIPYMQRGGSWDNSDVKGLKGWYNSNDGGRNGKKWTDADKAYDRSGAKQVGALSRKEKAQLKTMQAQKDIRKMNTQEFYGKLGAVKEVRNAPKISVGGAPEKAGFKFPWQK